MIKYKVIYHNILYRVLEIDSRPFPIFGENETGIKKADGMVGLLAINEDGELIHIFDEAWCFQFVKDIEG